MLCLPLTPDTTRLIGPGQLALMRRSAILINVGRGGLVAEPALVAALAGGQRGDVGLDVFEAEPLPASSPLWQFPNALLTPHVAGLGGLGEDRIIASVQLALDGVVQRRAMQTAAQVAGHAPKVP